MSYGKSKKEFTDQQKSQKNLREIKKRKEEKKYKKINFKDLINAKKLLNQLTYEDIDEENEEMMEYIAKDYKKEYPS